MSLDVTIAGPPDLSVGRIRLVKGDRHVGEWMVSPDAVEHRFEGLEAGVYRATTEPLGQPSRSFMFVLTEPHSNVAMPSLQAMASSDFAFANYRDVLSAAAAGSVKQFVQSAVQNLPQVIPPEKIALSAVQPSTRLTIGVSRCPSFEPRSAQPAVLAPPPEVTLLEGAIEIVLQRPDGEPGHDLSDIVLTCAVDGAQDSSLRVPFYTGGVRIACVASVLGIADLSFRVLPVDRTRRAITQALFAGSSREAAPVMATLAGSYRDGWQHDPWTAVASALLAMRFPDLDSFPQSVPPVELFSRFPWLTDAYVLEAYNQLRNARPDTPPRQGVLGGVVDLMTRAVAAGPPFFAYSAQLMDDVLSAIRRDEYLEPSDGDKLIALRRNKSAPRHAGASYAWLTSDTPSRTGSIDPRLATALVSGKVNQDRITLDTGATLSISEALTQITAPLVGAVAARIPGLRPAVSSFVQSQPWEEAWQGVRGLVAAGAAALGRPASPSPALSMRPEDGNPPPGLARPITISDDPYKGRFGRQAARDGFTLGARFIGGETANPVRIILSVTGIEEFASFDEVAEFFLHPTFRPNCLRVVFQGRAATVEVTSRGGFTVGVWLPDRSVELELDLAEAPNAPRIVREL